MNKLQRTLTLLGFTIGDDERANGDAGPSTREAVRRFQTDHGLPVTGEVDETTARAINTALGEMGVVDPTPTGTDPPAPNLPPDHLPPSNPPAQDLPFIVEGEVVKPDGTPLRGHLVRAYDRALCDWRELGSSETLVRTNDLGRYRISYDPAQLTGWGKNRADLKVEVHDPSGDVKLAESPLILRALPRERIDFSIGDQLYRGPDEYARVNTALASHLQSVQDLGCLEVADVVILAREAKLASSNVAYFVKAARWSAEFDAPAAMFYGLMRRGEPSSIDALLARPLKRLWTKLEEATSLNLISLPLNDALRAQLAGLQQSYLSRPDHPYARLLETTKLSGEQSATFTQRLTAGNLTRDEFWQTLETEDDFSAETVADVQAALELQSFTGENTSLTVRLRGDLAVGAPREVAAFSVEHWRDEVLNDATVKIPDEVLLGGTADERRAAYAQMLYRSAELRYPTPSLAGQLARKPLPGQDALQGFFTANPDFEFRDQRVLTFLRERPQVLDGLPETARNELLRVEQLFHLVPPEDKLAKIQPLWNAGLRSAPQVAYLGRGNLMRRVGPALDTRTAHRIYRKAVHVTSLALHVYLRYHPQLNSLPLTALQMPQIPTSQALARSAIAMPEWEELFGAPDACEYSHWESAISPAAYLVDTLAQLEKALDADGNNALDELLARRPDLGTLRLTCENTETPLPHIDLVNEILEAIVTSADGKTLSGAAIGETTWDSDLLGAQPEYLKTAAYDIVRTSIYPFDHAPFDLWAEEGRRYLAQMGIARDELMRVMPAQPGVDLLEIATEALGMNSVERELIRQPKTRPEELASRWGIDLAQGTLGAQLTSVEALLERAHIDYDTLLRLLNTRYANPDRLISVSFAGTPCSLDGAVLVGEGGAALVEQPFRELLDRLHRFLRLQRRLACTEYELDTLIQALGVADFNTPLFLPKLADTQALRDTLRLPLPELSAWWADLDTHAFEDELPSQYEAIFLDTALFPDLHSGVGPDLRRAVFALRADRADLAITTSTDASLNPWLAESDGADVSAYTLQPDYAAYIQSATRLTADDLLLLAGKVLPKDAATGHVALNLTNVSLLYRVASLARALKVSVSDTLRLIAITSVAPLRTASATPSPIDTRRFHDRCGAIDAGRHSVEELAYLLLHEPTAVAALAPATTDIDAWLASISPSFAGILAIEDARITVELKASLTQSLGSALGVDPAVLNAVLFTHRTGLGDELLAHVIVAANPGAPDLPTPGRDFATVFGQLHKLGLAWKGLGLDQAFLPFVLDKGPALGWFDIAAPPMAPQTPAQFDSWNRLVAAADLQASTFTLEQSLFTLMEDAAAATVAQARDPASFILDDFLTQISEWTGWTLAAVTYLTGPNGFNLNLPAAMRDETALVDLQRVFDLIRPRGVAAEQAHAWTIAELTFAETQAIKQTLSLAYPPDRWLEILGAIQDELRTLKRDALLGHLLTTLGMEDSDAFYRHYLIDPDQSPIDRTSRIVLAHSAVQLFAQRILLNLEDFKFERQEAEAWPWRKKYRVWEAARKVFLWPENWLEPELRDNKSAFFKELEDALLQEDMTTEAAGRIYHDYLVKLDQVSRLEIIGMYEDTWVNGDVDTNVLHVIGRTKDTPAHYYYRRWEEQSRWTPWEPVPLDIQSEHVTPIVYNGRLYVFWPTFTLTPIEPDTAALDEEIADLQERINAFGDLIEVNNSQIDKSPELEDLLQPIVAAHELLKQNLEADKGKKVCERNDLIENTPANDVEIGMAWSTYSGGRWLPKHVASSGPDPIATNFRPKDFYFTGWVSSDNRLYLAARGERTVETETGFDPCDPLVVTGPFQETDEYYPPPTTVEAIDVGYFSFDDCQSALVFVADTSLSAFSTSISASSLARMRSSTRIDSAFDPLGTTLSLSIVAPAGTVHVVDSKQSFDSRKLTGTELSFEIGAGDAPEVRLLLPAVTSPDARVRYAHQYGRGGRETSPFFYTETERAYFVRLAPDVIRRGLASELGSVTASRRDPQRTVTALTPRGAPLQRTAASNINILATTTTGHHYEAADAALIVNRGGIDLVTTTMQDMIGTVIEADPAPGLVATTGTAMSLTTPRYHFTRFYHPHTCLFLKQESRYGVDGLLRPDAAWGGDSAELYRQLMPSSSFDFEDVYEPNLDWVADNFDSEQLAEQIDFDHWSPYGLYNFELFFHIPLLVATRLMQNQRYAEARQWFHYIFDPTTASDGDGPERFWKIKPFYEEQLNGPLAGLDALLTEGSAAYEQQVEEWERDPFQPHVIARLRISAYMQTVVMRYLTCLIDEADMLFRRDTREDINEARQLYLLAAELLGEKPNLLPPQEASSLTPDLLLKRFRFDWNGPPGGDPLDWLVSYLPTGLSGVPASRSSARTVTGGLTVDTSIQNGFGGATQALGTPAQGGTSSVDTLLLFGIPHNEMLYEFWDTVADRLFKIRHSMNLSGLVRQLALFAPPIDPALLVRASAAGLSIESILSGLFAPRSNYRFSFMLQKALELCGEARGLGGAMLAALEKQDGEQITQLRSTHEISLLESIRALKDKTLDEAEASLAGLLKSRESAEFRAAYYASLERVSRGEQQSLDKQQGSMHWQAAAQSAEILGSGLSVIPTATSTGPQIGGLHYVAGLQAIAGSFSAVSAIFAYEANKASTMAGYDRRLKDWRFQVDLAKKEIEQLDKQIIAAEIRKQIAETDLVNHEQQIAQAQEVEDFLKLKFTNQQLYSFMVSKLASVHFQAYQMAYQLALQAQSAFYHELGPDEQSIPPFIKPDNWDSLKKGLLAGELLYLQLRQMEAAHMAANTRELEITKHVSLFQLDPTALLALRATGSCEFQLPEALFDRDFAGHFYRRLKAVQITIPCIVGPYANVSATLSLLDSSTRRNTDLSDADQPVQDLVAAPQAAIATSSANRDVGVFELNFNDPRYLPFEGAGVMSTWRLELPSAIRPFDYATISDVVMHVSYTARAGDDAFKASVNDSLVSALNDPQPRRLFSLRQEFPDAWNQLVNTAGEPTRTCTLPLSKAHFPAFLDYAWRTAQDETIEALPITLDVTGLTGYLSPQGAMPEADGIVLNQQPATGVELGMPAFELTSALSSTSIGDADVVACELTIDEMLRAEDWNDLYLLMDYNVRV